MKMVMVSYNSAINSEVMEALEKCGIENYTKWVQVQGKGKTSGPHFGSEIWPGENAALFIATQEEKVSGLLSEIRALREKLGRVGVKAFVWPLEQIT
ncbi:MAG: hypothetical protein ISS45_03865 [Candidatus Omnitrophica bacterium]|nr:hypothetical protein [Candidatus Omnitrophota bacterium]